MLMESERTVDLLQGLLVYSRWLVALPSLSFGLAGHLALRFLPRESYTSKREFTGGPLDTFQNFQEHKHQSLRDSAQAREN